MKMNFYNFNDFPGISFFEDPHILTIGIPFREDGFRIECILPQKHRIYGNDAGQPARSLHTKRLLPLCDKYVG